MAYSLIIAGSTTHTCLIAKSVLADQRFEIKLIVTPAPKPIGRKQEITKNPLQLFAEENKIPTVLVEKKLDQNCRSAVTSQLGSEIQSADFLLVVDFGYYVPKWLLQQARIQPLNIHPSALPAWRGSSPGQFVLLSGAKESAISLITVAAAMDQGNVWLQPTFSVDPNWNSASYYFEAFTLIAPLIPETLYKIAQNTQIASPQPAISPTIMARRLDKKDSFVPWSVLRATQTKTAEWIEQATTDLTKYLQQTQNEAAATEPQTPILAELLSQQSPTDWPIQLERACRAFSPWPKLWTLAPTPKGEQRLIILELRLENSQVTLPQLQLEGKTPASWAQLKTAFTLS